MREEREKACAVFAHLLPVLPNRRQHLADRALDDDLGG